MGEEFPLNCLVLYKNRPALIKTADKKISLEMEDGSTAQVRPKDIQQLHPGPLRSLADLKRSVPPAAPLAEVWELLAGSTFDLQALAELAFDAYTPAAAWACWQWVAEGLYFSGTPEAITACTAEELAEKQRERQAKAAEKQAWESFVQRAREGKISGEDQRSLEETIRLAYGQTDRSALLAALNLDVTPESAHAFLLRSGVWSEQVNPYPRRWNQPLTAPDLAFELPAAPEEERLDLTHLAAYAIDDEGTVNPDDALSLDGERLWVHISDPAAVIAPGSPYDQEASQRGETLHLPERPIHLLPEEAIRRFGLGLLAVSPALSFGIDFAEDGSIRQAEIRRTWVKVTRLTYDGVEERIDQPPFDRMDAAAQRYAAYRARQGSLTLDFPEAKIWVEESGAVQVKPLKRLRSRMIVQEAMLAAGEATARFAQERSLPMPYSTNSSELTAVNVESMSGQFALRRTLRPSQYRVTPSPHTLLGLPAYIQATSPLRRSLDLAVHQQIRASLCGGKIMDETEILERIGAAEANLGALRAAERDSEKHWTLVYLRQHPDWEGQAVLVEKRDRRGILLVSDLALEVEVSLPGDLSLDQVVRVRLISVDLPRLRASFNLI